MDFSGKVVLITGGSSGIGLALAKEFAARDAFVCLAARRAAVLDNALKEIAATPSGGKMTFQCDVSRPDQVEDLVENVVKTAGAPDILINSAGVVQPGYIRDLDMQTFEEMMEINYFGTVHTVKSILPGMTARRSGVIVNIGSLASYFSVIGYSAYSASKFALRAFTEALRMEVSGLGIHVAMVLPPDTDTPQLVYDNLHKPDELKYLFPELGVIAPEKVAQAVVRGIERRQYEIVPDWGSRLMLWAYRPVGSGYFKILDALLARARRRIAREQMKA
jgi:3-dehydrosphinganine reductase